MKIVMPWVTDPAYIDELRRDYPSVAFVLASTPVDLAREIEDADAISDVPPPELFSRARKLRWIQILGAGVDWLMTRSDVVQSDVQVTNARGAQSATIGDHALALLLALTRRMIDFQDDKRRRSWNPAPVVYRHGGPPTLVGLSGKTMGVVGFGTIGRAIARRALGFDMAVIGVDVHQVPPMEGVRAVWTLDRLHEMLEQIDVLAIAAPLTPLTRGLIGPREIGLLRPGSLLIVVSRGGIVDEPALIEALGSGRLRGAGVDVAATEPLPPDSPLWDVENLLITPHIAGVSKQSIDQIMRTFHENVGRFVRGEPLLQPVDKKLGY